MLTGKQAVILCLMFQCTVITATENTKVLILGAGMTGATTAKKLKELGEDDFIILEGFDRVGGRARQQKLGVYNVQVGPLWVYGGELNPMLDVIKESDLSTFPNDYDDYIAYNEDGLDVTNVTDAIWEQDVWEDLPEWATKAQKQNHPDMSVRSAARVLGWNPKTPEEMLVEQFEIDFETGTLPNIGSAKNLFNWKYEGDYIIDDIDEGYSGVVAKQMEAALSKNDDSVKDNSTKDNSTSDNSTPKDDSKKLYLNSVVNSIEQNDTHVIVQTDDGRTFTGEHAIITFSLGVLQNEKVSFKPDLPDWKMSSIHGFNHVNYLQFYIQFPTAFWDDEEWILYASKSRGYYPFWQNFNKYWPGSNIIQGTVTEPESDRVALLSDDEIIAEAMSVLIRLYGPGIPSPSGIAVSRWATDPLFMGSFSDWSSGFSDASHEALRASVGRLHFAGEHTSHQYFGYFVGAHEEGNKIAEKVTSCLRENECAEYRAPYLNRGCTYTRAFNFDKDAIEENGTCRFFACHTSGNVQSVALFLNVVIGGIVASFLMYRH